MTILVTEIDWDTDGDREAFDGLPQVVRIPMEDLGLENPDDESGQIANWLSDNYGWCVNSLNFEIQQSTEE